MYSCEESNFIRETLDPEYFKLENVIGDNACFYRSVANGIMNGFEKNPNKKYGSSLETQTALAKELQAISYQWIKKNQNKIINWNLGDSELNLSLKSLVEMVHDIKFQQYMDLYQYFAGDYVIDKFTTNIEYMANRWGSYVEQLAISQRLEIPIVVFVLQKYDKKNKKIITGRIYNQQKIYKNTRLKILQITGKEFIYKNPTIFLLWKKNKIEQHYMSLYPINLQIQNDLVSSIIN